MGVDRRSFLLGTVSAAALGGAGYMIVQTMPYPAATNPADFAVISRSGDVNAWQGVAFDGTYYYATADWTGGSSSQQWILQKYDASFNLVDSQDMGAYADSDHKQINGVYLHEGRLYISANNFPTTPARGWVIEVDPTDLSEIDSHELSGAKWTEAVTRWGGYWWAVNATSHEIRQFDDDWALVDAHALPDASPGGLFWQAIIVLNNVFYLNVHAPSASGIPATPALRAYSWNGSGFDRETALDTFRPSSYCTQGFTYFNGFTYWAERYDDGDTAEGRIVKATATAENPPAPYVALDVTFTGSNGSTTFTDAGDGGHTLTAAGNAQIQSNKLELDGTGDWVTVARHPDFEFDLERGFTIEIFGFEPDAAGPLIGVYDAFTPWEDHRCWFITNNPNGTMRVGLFEDGSTASDLISETWTPGEVDIALVYDPAAVGDNLYLYIDQTRVATAEYTDDWLDLANTPLTIGGINTRASTAGNRQSLNGRMARVKITHAALYTGASY